MSTLLSKSESSVETEISSSPVVDPVVNEINDIIVLKKNELPFITVEFIHALIDRLRTRRYEGSEHTVLEFLVPKILKLDSYHRTSSIGVYPRAAGGTKEVLEFSFDDVGFCLDIILSALEFQTPIVNSGQDVAIHDETPS